MVVSADDSISAVVDIPDNVTNENISYVVTSIKSAAFFQMAITSVKIPKSVVSLEPVALLVGPFLTSITVDVDNQYYCAVDDILYNKNQTSLISCAGGKRGAVSNIPNTVTSIAFSAFRDLGYVTSVTLPDSVLVLEGFVFGGSSTISEIVLPGSINSIEGLTFIACGGLTSLTVYGNVTSIDMPTAFQGVSPENVTISLPTGIVGGRALDQRQQTWRDAGFSKFTTAPKKVVSFDSRSGSAVAALTVAPNVAAAQPTNPTRTGYTFTGWYKEPACQNAFNFDTAITESVTLYAGWTPNAYDVVFNPNGASNAMENQEITYDTATNLNANTLTRPGYTFTGWAESATGDVKYADQASVTNLTSVANGQVNLYAKWKANTYTLAFDANGGAGTAMDQVERTYDDTAVALPTPTFSKTGYTFSGWNTQANGGGTSYTATGAYNNFTTAAGATVTLYAQWKANTYNVVFNPNGASNTMSDFKKTYNDSAALPKCTLIRPGYIFSKWTTKQDGTGTNYNDEAVDDLTTTTDPVTLFAQWTPILSASVPIKVLATVDGSGNVTFTDAPTSPVRAQTGFTYGIESRSPVDLKVTKISLDYLAGAATVFPEGRENVAIKVSGIAINPDVPFVPDSLLALRAAGNFRVPAATYGESGSVTPGKLSLPLALDLGGTRVTHLADTSTEIATLTYTIDFAEKG